MTMTDARWDKTAEFMRSAGLLKPDFDIRNAYTLDLVQGVTVRPGFLFRSSRRREKRTARSVQAFAVRGQTDRLRLCRGAGLHDAALLRPGALEELVDQRYRFTDFGIAEMA